MHRKKQRKLLSTILFRRRRRLYLLGFKSSATTAFIIMETTFSFHLFIYLFYFLDTFRLFVVNCMKEYRLTSASVRRGRCIWIGHYRSRQKYRSFNFNEFWCFSNDRPGGVFRPCHERQSRM